LCAVPLLKPVDALYALFVYVSTPFISAYEYACHTQWRFQAVGGFALSISQINKLFQNKGCNIAVSAVLGVAVISMLGVGSRGCTAGQDERAAGGPTGMPVVAIGDYEVTKEAVDQVAENQLGGGQLAATLKTPTVGRALIANINLGLALLLAKKQGVDLSDQRVKQRALEQEFEQIRNQLESMQMLSPEASQQAFEDAYKKVGGRSYSEARKEVEQNIDAKLADPKGREDLLAHVAPLLLIDEAKSKFIPTEAAVKTQFDTLKFKIIDVYKKDAGAEGVMAKAKRIHAEIKAGMSFEAAMEKYNVTAPAKGKKKSDETRSIPAAYIESSEEAKSLLKLKPGEVSEVISTPSAESAQIFKFVDRKIELPKDFEKQKKGLMEAKARNDAAKSVTDQLKKLDTPENVKWKNDGYRLLHDFAVMDQATDAKKPDRLKTLRELLDSALKLIEEPLSGDIASAIAMVAYNELRPTLSPAERDKFEIPIEEAYVHHYP
jgi:hypothetical protein